MVTTRITLAVPMTMPSPVRSVRTGLARSASALKRNASPINPKAGHFDAFDAFDTSARAIGLAALRLPEQLLGVGPGRIVGRENQTHVWLEESSCNSKIR